MTLTTLLLAVAMAAAAPAQDPQPAPVPALEFDPEVLDLGTVLTGTKATVGASFRNAGSSDLLVQRFQGNCGCIKPSVIVGGKRMSPLDLQQSGQPLVLRPGDEARLEVEFDGKGRSGAVDKKVWFFVGDTPPVRVAVTVKAECDPGYSVEPVVFNFEEPVIQGTAVTRSVVLEPSVGWEGKITGTSYAIPGVVAKCVALTTEDGKPTGKTRIDLTITEDAKVGPFLWPIEIKTDSAEVPVIRIPVRAEVAPVVQCLGPSAQQPRVVDFGIIKGTGPESSDASIVNYDPSVPYSVRRVVVNSRQEEHIQAKVITEKEGELYTLRLTVLPTLKAGSFNGSVVLESDHPSVPSLQIWFRGAVRHR